MSMRARGLALLITGLSMMATPTALAQTPEPVLPSPLPLAAPAPVASPVPKRSLEERVKALDEVMKRFEVICLNADGKLIEGIVVDSSGAEVNCPQEADRLERELKALQDEAEQERKRAEVDAAAAPSARAFCSPEQEAYFMKLPPEGMIEVLKRMDDGKTTKGCLTEKSDMLSGACAAEVSCQGIRSFLLLAPGPRLVIEKLLTKADQPLLNRCLSSKTQSNCLLDIFKGVTDSLWVTVTSLADLAVMAGKGAYNGAKAGANWAKEKVSVAWRFWTGVEDKSSEALMAASVQENSALALFKKSPLKFIGKMAEAMIDMIGEAIRTTYGCQKWSGPAYRSTCVIPMESWACSDCQQKLAAVCGVSGYLGGEVLSSVLTGGIAAAVKASALTTTKIAVKLAQKLAVAMPKAAEAAKVAGGVVGKAAEPLVSIAKQSASLVGSGWRATGEALSRLSQTRAAVAVTEFARKGGARVLAAAKDLKRYKVVQVAVIGAGAAGKGAKVALTPARAYWDLLGEATREGFIQADAKFIQLMGRAGLTTHTVEKSYRAIAVMKDGQIIQRDIAEPTQEAALAAFQGGEAPAKVFTASQPKIMTEAERARRNEQIIREVKGDSTDEVIIEGDAVIVIVDNPSVTAQPLRGADVSPPIPDH